MIGAALLGFVVGIVFGVVFGVVLFDVLVGYARAEMIERAAAAVEDAYTAGRNYERGLRGQEELALPSAMRAVMPTMQREKHPRDTW